MSNIITVLIVVKDELGGYQVKGERMRLYAAKDKNTGKLVSGITNPSHKFWQRQGDCESAIRRYSNSRYKRGNYDLELVTYELVEVREGEVNNGEANN